MGGTITDTDRGFAAAETALRKLAGKKHVVVGVRSAAGSVQPTGSALNMAEIATVNEFGSPDGRVPERSFLRSTYDNGKSRYTGLMEEAVGRASAEGGDIHRELELLGLQVAADVVETINAGVGPANAPATIARKGSAHPLIDSGRLRQSIDSEVREGGGE